MDAHESRRANLEYLIGQHGDGVLKRFAELTDINPNYLSQIRGGTRKMGSAIARKIESHLDLDAGWVDRPQAIPTEVRDVVPLIEWNQIAAWEAMVESFQPTDADRWIPCPRGTGPRAFAIAVMGDALDAPNGVSAPRGSVLLIDPDVAPCPGAIVIADTQADAPEVGQLAVEPAHRYLRPLNPQFAVKPLANDARIYGVAVQIIIELAQVATAEGAI